MLGKASWWLELQAFHQTVPLPGMGLASPCLRWSWDTVQGQRTVEKCYSTHLPITAGMCVDIFLTALHSVSRSIIPISQMGGILS